MAVRSIPAILFAFLVSVSAAFANGDEEQTHKFYRGVIDDDVFTAGETVDIDGEVEGDVFAAGGSVGVNGSVSDQLIAAGGQVTVTADVAGDLIVAGGKLDVSGSVGDNLVAAGGSITVRSRIAGKAIAAGGQVELGRDATVAGPAWISGGQVTVRGVVDGDALLNGGMIQIYGDIRGNVDARAEEVSVMPGARIGGTLTVRGPRAPEIASDAVVMGDVVHVEQKGLEGLKEKTTGLIAVAALLPFLFCIVVGLLLVYGTPTWVAATADTLKGRPLASLGLGFLIVFGVPGVLGALAFTVIGIPITVIGFAAYVILMVIAMPLVVLAASRILLMRKAGASAPGNGKLLLLFVGLLIVVGLIAMVPFIGQFVLGALFLLGAGAGLLALYNLSRASKEGDQASGTPV